MLFVLFICSIVILTIATLLLRRKARDRERDDAYLHPQQSQSPAWVAADHSVEPIARKNPVNSQSIGEAASQTSAPVKNPYWMVPDAFVVLDLETTGLSPKRNKIIEIGALKAQRSQLSQTGLVTFPTFQTLIKVRSHLPQFIVELTGITDAMLKADGTPLDQAIDELLEFCGDLPIVAFNASFDIAFLNAALGELNQIANPIVCALSMARRAYPGQPSYKLANLAIGVDAGQSHRAIADCHRALIVYINSAQKLGGSD